MTDLERTERKLDVIEAVAAHLGTDDERTRQLAVAILDAMKERVKQDQRFGVQDLDPFYWAAILAEEVGEYCAAAQAVRLLPDGSPDGQLLRAMRLEAVQVAAVAVAMVECLDRAQWSFTGKQVSIPKRPKA